MRAGIEEQDLPVEVPSVSKPNFGRFDCIYSSKCLARRGDHRSACNPQCQETHRKDILLRRGAGAVFSCKQSSKIQKQEKWTGRMREY